MDTSRVVIEGCPARTKNLLLVASTPATNPLSKASFLALRSFLRRQRAGTRGWIEDDKEDDMEDEDDED